MFRLISIYKIFFSRFAPAQSEERKVKNEKRRAKSEGIITTLLAPRSSKEQCCQNLFSKGYLLFTILIFLFNPAIAQVPFSACVVNSVGVNLSVINLENHTVNANAAALGLYTNQVVIRGEKAYVINSGLNEIQVIDLATLNTVQNIDLGNGTNPWAMDFVDDNIAAVSLLFTNQVKFVNINTGQVIQTVTVGTGPEGIKYGNGKVYVANSGFNGAGYDPGKVSVIDAANYSVSDIAVGLNPQALDLDSQGNIVVACTGDYAAVGGQMDVIDPNTQQVVHSAPAGIPITFVAANSAGLAYLSTFGSAVLVYNLVTRVFERDAANPLPGGPGIAFDGQDNAYITGFSEDSVYVFSPGHQKTNAYLVGDGPVSIAIYDPNPNSIGDLSDPVAGEFTLYQNYPNPFNPQTTIRFNAAASEQVLLEIYNLLGERIQTLVNKRLPAGTHEVEWNGKDALGRAVPSGTYFYRLQMKNQSSVRKMLFIQ